MLEPREADLPVLFLVLVVFPVVAYVLLGKWSEISKKRGRVNLLAQMAAEEALRAQRTASATVVPVVVPIASPSKNNGLHECAMCFTPATTRCSRCKSVRYCSGKCQITHWRQIHKDECVPAEISTHASSPEALKEKVSLDYGVRTSMSKLDFSGLDCSLGDATSHIPTAERRKKSSCISKGETSRKFHAFQSTEETCQSKATCSGYTDNNKSSKEAGHRHKSRHSYSSTSETVPIMPSSTNSSILTNEQTLLRSKMNGSYKHQGQPEAMVEPRSSNIQHSVKVAGARTTRLPKAIARKSGEQLCSHIDRKEQLADESRFSMARDTPPNEGSNGVASMKVMKKIGLRKSTELTRDDAFEKYGDSCKRMLFPYEEFVKFFQSEVFDLYPRGLVNCGNSCYANAVLQCLTCTKPLVVYLLRRSHSRLSCRKDWCLMCELEQHVITLRETGGPLSLSRILSHMRSLNCRIGGGSQEDAHEFLRVLVASMQSICLDGLGGESKVDPRLQETTFIQHTFGGRLRSKVKCLRCHHESERYENIMDLTLEINGWVESLEDALTQFTTPEDLDGENMYRCGRCAEYVLARKQLRVHEAPNILTIVLKRFQEGRYGKINKCITFPDMLDMTPFMTGTADIPPLYMLYAVVVHLDILNASFSGHYVSYVKDLHGNWLKIDDTEVCPMPLSQVMSEGAYILFYMRSHPRPQRASHNNRTQKQQVPSSIKHCQSRNQKPSFQEQSKPANHFVGTHPNPFKPRIPTGFENHSAYSGSISSDWSLFTSSDESSFTTESTRDSFSTIDYSDGCNSDPFSIFNGLYNAELSSHNTVACRMFSGTEPHTLFVSEEKGYILDSEDYQGTYVNYGTNPGFSMDKDTYS